MRGYAYFTVAFAASVLILAMLHLNAAAFAYDESAAISVERAYCAGMDAKAAALESARQGALRGFALYDAIHSTEACLHCEDHFCSPPAPGIPPGQGTCDRALCAACFRESGARAAAREAGESAVFALNSHTFDPDFRISIGKADLSVVLAPDALAKNGFALGAVSFPSGARFSLSSVRFGIESSPAILPGTVIRYESAGLG